MNSHISKKICFSPGWISGFIDAEASFMLLILRNRTLKMGYQVALCFSIGLHIKDLAILEGIKAYFKGIGSITFPKKNVALFRITSLKDLAVLIKHIVKYPLLSQKCADYKLFKKAI